MITHSDNFVSAPVRLSNVLVRQVAGGLEGLRRWRASQETARLLDELSDRQLQDIGIQCRADIRERARNSL